MDSIIPSEGQSVLDAAVPLVVEPGGRDAVVSQPFLDLGEIGVVLERGGRPQRMRREPVHRDPGLPGPLHHDADVSRLGVRGLVLVRSLDGPKQKGPGVVAVVGGIEVGRDEFLGAGMEGKVADLRALSFDLEVGNSPAGTNVRDPETAQLVVPAGEFCTFFKKPPRSEVDPEKFN